MIFLILLIIFFWRRDMRLWIVWFHFRYLIYKIYFINDIKLVILKIIFPFFSFLNLNALNVWNVIKTKFYGGLNWYLNLVNSFFFSFIHLIILEKLHATPSDMFPKYTNLSLLKHKHLIIYLTTHNTDILILNFIIYSNIVLENLSTCHGWW